MGHAIKAIRTRLIYPCIGPLINSLLPKEQATTYNLCINTDKATTTLFVSDPTEYGTTLSLKLNNQTLPTIKYPKILEITLDPKLTF